MKRRPIRRYLAYNGNTISEYGLLIASVALLAIASLYNFRDSVAQLFDKTPKGLAEYNVLAPVGAVQIASKTPYKAVIGKIDPVTGLPVFVTSTSGAPENATSVDGTSIGSWAKALSLEQLAQNEKNPDFTSYYAQLAKLSYYIGAAEGRLDGLEQFYEDRYLYQPDDALIDLVKMQGDLQTLLQRPPEGITDTAAFKMAVPLATDVFNIAERYRNAFKSQLDENGNVKAFWIDENRPVGPGTGLSAELNLYLPSNFKPEYLGDTPVTSKYTYAEIQGKAKDVVNNTNLDAPLVKQTFNDAIDLDATEEASTNAPGT